MLTFKDIKGHEDSIARLSTAIGRKTLASAYLFHGPEGIGKFSAAKAFARAVNCETETGHDCGICSSCLRIDGGNHPDVHVINEGYDTEIKIECVRQLQQEICLRPYEARYKIFILNDSHNLNAVAANALLKTLEDTPAKSIIVLVTDKPRVMPATIVSRCRRENFRPLSRAAFMSALAGQGFDAPAREYLSYSCEGRLGMALKLKGSPVISDKNSAIDRVLSGRLDDSMKREDIRKELAVMAVWFRDVYVTKLGLETAINGDRKRELAQCAARYGFADLERIFAAISSSLLYLEQNVNSKLLLANLQVSLQVGRAGG
jgi:DNA polymerase III subunit delta'